MDRRRYVSLLAGGMVVPAGCLSAPTGGDTPASPDATEDNTSNAVSVTKRVEAGRTGLTRILRVQDGGSISIEVSCPDAEKKTTIGQLSTQVWRQFKQLVRSTDLTAFQSAYECDTHCPSDIPPVHLTITTGSQTADILIEAGADRPESLEEISSRLTGLSDTLDVPACSE